MTEFADYVLRTKSSEHNFGALQNGVVTTNEGIRRMRELISTNEALSKYLHNNSSF